MVSNNNNSPDSRMREKEDRELMQQMVRDHANGLAFVAEIMELATSASDEELPDTIKRVQEFNANELEPHLQHEEQTILGPLLRNHPEHRELCITIGKEHGYIRTLVEEMHPDSARADLTEFGRTLESHTKLEDEFLFPLVETLFNMEQKQAIADFIPLGHRKEVQHATIQPVTIESSSEYTDCLVEVKRFFSNAAKHDGSIVLLPRYDPDVSAWLADQIGSDLYNYQAEVMADFGGEAASITLEQLTESLRSRAEKSSIVSHNVEALLCTKPEHERRDWLQSFLDTDWPNTILLPITIYQAEVPTGHAKVCDLELYKFSWLNRNGRDQVANN